MDTAKNITASVQQSVQDGTATQAVGDALRNAGAQASNAVQAVTGSTGDQSQQNQSTQDKPAQDKSTQDSVPSAKQAHDDQVSAFLRDQTKSTAGQGLEKDSE